VLARHKPFASIATGDVVAVMDAGAYFIPNQMNFSNPRAAVVMVDGPQCRVLRERERFEDIVRLDQVPWRMPDAPPASQSDALAHDPRLAGDAALAQAQALAERRPA
jgi:hypothetical protein